jgi:galactosyl transferase GMA12/MNN10 family
MKKCILTAYDNNIKNCLGLSEILDNKKSYSKKYDWDFVTKTNDDFDKNRPSAFSKIKFISECLNDYDLLLWTDMDCFFTNFTIDIAQILKDDEYIAVLEENSGYFNTGNILVKSNDYTKNFFSSLQLLKSWDDFSHPWEQRCFNDQVWITKYNHIKRLKVNEFGAFLWDHFMVRKWQRGDFILHIGGGHKLTPWQERINLWLTTYKKQIVYV